MVSAVKISPAYPVSACMCSYCIYHTWYWAAMVSIIQTKFMSLLSLEIEAKQSKYYLTWCSLVGQQKLSAHPLLVLGFSKPMSWWSHWKKAQKRMKNEMKCPTCDPCNTFQMQPFVSVSFLYVCFSVRVNSALSLCVPSCPIKLLLESWPFTKAGLRLQEFGVH